MAHKLDVLRRHCTELGRDYDTIAKSILYTGGWPGDGFVDEMRRYADLGIDTVVLMPGGPDPAGAVAALGEDLVPRLAALPA